MERIKKLVMSPSTRRKKLELGGGVGDVRTIHKVFGVSLEELMSKAPAGAVVPSVVSKMCEFIYKYGLDSVGLFRVSGSVRVVEQMRAQFEQKGDVDLDQEDDVAAVASLLKVFLRDLPETLIPEGLTHNFFSIVQNSKLSKGSVVSELKKALKQMPDDSYNLLKYVSSLLVVVAEHEVDNKMSAYSLAILFGPNIFKYELSTGIEGFKDMDSSKDVMQWFISEYEALFTEAGEPNAREFWGQLNKKKTPPPRPPPPKVMSLPSFSSPSLESLTPVITMSPSTTSLDTRPVPSPRKMKNIYDNSTSLDLEDRQIPVFYINSSIPLMSPRDFDHMRAQSPFALESESHSILESPMVTARTNEIVEKTIVETISQFIGITDFNQNAGSLTPRLSQSTDDSHITNSNFIEPPVPKARLSTRDKSKNNTHIQTNSNWEMAKDNVEESEIDGMPEDDRDNRPTLPQSLNLQESPSSQNSSNNSDRSPSNGIKLFIPPLDFSTLHEHIDGSEPIPITKERFDTQLWVSTNHLSEPDVNVAIISPRSNKLKKRHDCPEEEAIEPVVFEAPMSPSAQCGSGIFRASVNTDIPPSPPVQQDVYKKYSDDEGSYYLRQITKKIQGLKKKIKNFEENFEKDYGYRPTHGEKASNPDVKKYMNELSKARKDLKRLKEETEMGNRVRHNSGASSSGVDQPAQPTIRSTLDYIQKCLYDKRQESARPEEVSLMSRDEVQDEKLAVQKALLYFEGLHGRPCSKEEKDIMRPLYDRYRAIKRTLAKPLSPRNSLELQTVPEDQMMEIPTSFTRQAIHVPTAIIDEEEDTRQDVGTMDFGLVTRDINVMREMDFTSYGQRRNEHIGFNQEKGDGEKKMKKSEDSGDAHLHELSLSELHAEIETSRKSKKKLRRILREFEESFLCKTGRKVMKEDRYPLETEYSDYKKVKARLRLLEALVLKHHERKEKF